MNETAKHYSNLTQLEWLVIAKAQTAALYDTLLDLECHPHKTLSFETNAMIMCRVTLMGLQDVLGAAKISK